jgi:molybdopterin synthase catalytic subunit
MMRASVVERPIDLPALLDEVASVAAGATSAFVGTVRDTNDGRSVVGIEYSAYSSMAEREMRAILDEAGERYGIERAVVEHRIGTLRLGEASVAIVVAHAHRGPALDACRHIIEELKRRVPVWKREHYVDGTREWVDPSGKPVEATP